jgi:hypothetical protein
MDKQNRPLDTYFEAARREPGISESEVRSIVRDGVREGSGYTRRWVLAGIGAAGAIAISVGVLFDGTGGAPHEVARVARQIQADNAPARSAGAPLAARDAARATARIDTTTTTPSISTEGTMNRRNIMRNAAIAALATATLTSGAEAQERKTEKKVEKIRIEHHGDVEPWMDEMAAELGRKAAEFWTARLNSYKTRIDRALSPSDLEKLNRLRVRFGVMLADKIDIDADLQNGTVSTEEEFFVQHKVEKNDGANSEKRTHKIEMDVNMGSADAMEIFGLHQGAKELAGAYRGDMDALAKDVLVDAATFVRTMKEAGDRFVQANRVEVEKTENGRTLALELNKSDDFVNALSDPESQPMIQMVYSMMLEPLIMLYDGSDLTSFFGQSPLASAVTGMKLPATSALQQNVPNPASGTTTITYRLDEPSSATTLRLFDASGSLVGTYDQGVRASGDHSATVDLSSLPNGTYLYHLTVKTAGGERVYSKAMQVAR